MQNTAKGQTLFGAALCAAFAALVFCSLVVVAPAAHAQEDPYGPIVPVVDVSGGTVTVTVDGLVDIASVRLNGGQIDAVIQNGRVSFDTAAGLLVIIGQDRSGQSVEIRTQIVVPGPVANPPTSAAPVRAEPCGDRALANLGSSLFAGADISPGSTVFITIPEALAACIAGESVVVATNPVLYSGGVPATRLIVVTVPTTMKAPYTLSLSADLVTGDNFYAELAYDELADDEVRGVVAFASSPNQPATTTTLVAAPLAVTGSSAMPLVAAGVAMVVCGSLLWAAGARRTRNDQ